MKYKAEHIRRLHSETRQRCNHLLDVLIRSTSQTRDDFITVDSYQVRMAVDDFKNVLSEMRRLK